MRFMRRGWRQAIGVMAIYAVALHVLLPGFSPVVAGDAPAAPGFVVCHSDRTGIPPRQTDGDVPGADSCCDHCDLCNALATPPLRGASYAQVLTPTLVLEVLRPLSTAARLSLSRDPKRARGPPQAA